jgi:UDP-N-acetylglucosamine 2-epimerase (non-hydrolysing)
MSATKAGKPLRILSVIGTRPEAIKMAPVVQAIAATPGMTGHPA